MIKMGSNGNEISITTQNKIPKQVEFLIKSLSAIQLLLIESPDNDKLKQTMEIISISTSNIKDIFSVTQNIGGTNAFD